jgi:hypothetical protein
MSWSGRVTERAGLVRRLGAIFFELADAPPSPAGRAAAEAAEVAAPPPRNAAVVGAAGAVVPVAAAVAGELRARHRAAAALLCVWRPGGVESIDDDRTPAARSPAGATTPGASRLAARLVAHELPATACGRLAWLLMDTAPGLAADQARRCLDMLAEPVVIALAGPRPAAFEPLLAELELAVAVLPASADESLRALALAGLPTPARHLASPLAPGPARWSALTGLARFRSLPAAPP